MSRIVLVGFFLAALVAAQGPAPSADLKQAATDSRTPALKKFYEEFAVPHDLVLVSGTTDPIRVVPVPVYNKGGSNKLNRAVKVVPLDPKAPAISGADIQYHYSYEALALAGVDKFLKNQDTLPALERLSAGERVLAAVLQFHESERQAGVRKGAEWASVRTDVRSALFKIRLEQLESRTSGGDLDRATALARRLLDTYAAGSDGDGPAPEGLAANLVQLIDRIQSDARLEDDRKLALLEQLSKAIRPHKERKVVERAVGKLHDLAGAALARADDANKRTPPDTEQAQMFYGRAERLWPDHEGLGQFELHVQRPNTILRVGVRELPVLMSPALATTDNERRVVDLLFDSLVKPHRDDQGLLTYVAALADGPPVVIPQGRRFHLARTATWSDGKPVQAADVRHTVAQIAGDKAGLDSLRCRDFLNQATFSGDIRQVDLFFHRVGIDPLSPTTFAIIPDGTSADSKEFAKKPIGSGPYALEGLKQLQGRRTLVFRARTSRAAIRFIHFVATEEPVKDFERGLIDLALDVQPDQIAAWRKRLDELRNGPPVLRDRLKLEVTLPTVRTPNRRIYFLRVGEGNPVAPTAEVRRAVAWSIPRERLLSVLRKDLGSLKVHRPLPGLYPPDTWAAAVHPMPRPDLYDAEKARTFLGKAILSPTTWTLKIPAGDAALRGAFDLWAKELEALTAGKLKLAIVEAGPADLIYDWYDFPDDTFWLEPLFVRVKHRDRELDRLLLEARDYRDFARVKRATGELASHLDAEMPVIPLWQLDPLHLVHDSVKPADLDPRRVFGSIDRWTLNR